MIILFGKNGQLCNRLFNISAFFAHAIEHKSKVLCIGFEDYYKQFEKLNEAGKKYDIRFIEPTEKWQKAFLYLTSKLAFRFSNIARIFKLETYNGNGDINATSIAKLSISNILFVKGWPYWDVENFIKHSILLRNIFSPSFSHIQNVSSFINALPKGYTQLVGVHIRLGDYKEYLGGRFYYSLDTYKSKMVDLNNELKDKGENPLFIICTNEKLNIDWGAEVSYILSNLDAVADLLLLSKCNFLFGAPSTFSMWASFYGNVPYTVLLHENEKLKINDFSPIIAPSTFASGRRLIDIHEK